MGNTLEASAARGQVVDVGQHRVKIKHLLGEGGFAYVFLCQDVRTGQELVLKRMRIAADNDESLALASREVELMRRLPRHPNVVACLDACVSDARGRDGFVDYDILLEYCSAGNALQELAALQARGETMPEGRVLRRFRDLALGLAHLHSQRPPIVHFDVKPENLLLTPDPAAIIAAGAAGAGAVGSASSTAAAVAASSAAVGPDALIGKLCDLGSAVPGGIALDTDLALANAEGIIEKTTTLAYRAPEMVDLRAITALPREARRIGPAADVWALGATLYKLAFLRTPFEDASGAPQRMAILNGRVTIPPHYAFSTPLGDLIKACLTLDAAKRPTVFAVLQMAATTLRAWPGGGLRAGVTAPPAASAPVLQASAREGSLFGGGGDLTSPPNGAGSGRGGQLARQDRLQHAAYAGAGQMHVGSGAAASAAAGASASAVHSDEDPTDAASRAASQVGTRPPAPAPAPALPAGRAPPGTASAPSSQPSVAAGTGAPGARPPRPATTTAAAGGSAAASFAQHSRTASAPSAAGSTATAAAPPLPLRGRQPSAAAVSSVGGGAVGGATDAESLGLFGGSSGDADPPAAPQPVLRARGESGRSQHQIALQSGGDGDGAFRSAAAAPVTASMAPALSSSFRSGSRPRSRSNSAGRESGGSGSLHLHVPSSGGGISGALSSVAAGIAERFMSEEARNSVALMGESLQTRMMQLLGGDVKKHRWVIKATSRIPGPPKQKYVRRLVLDAWESGSGGATLTYLPKRPLGRQPVVALKAVVLLMKLWQQGPPGALAASTLQVLGLLIELENVWADAARSGGAGGGSGQGAPAAAGGGGPSLSSAAGSSPSSFAAYLSSYAAYAADKLAFHRENPAYDAHLGMDKVAAATAAAVARLQEWQERMGGAGVLPSPGRGHAASARQPSQHADDVMDALHASGSAGMRAAASGDLEAAVATVSLIVDLLESAAGVAEAALALPDVTEALARRGPATAGASIAGAGMAPGAAAAVLGARRGSHSSPADGPSPFARTAVGSLPPLVSETWDAYCLSAMMLLRLRPRLQQEGSGGASGSRGSGAAAQQLQRLRGHVASLCDAVDLCGARLHGIYSGIAKVAAHPALRWYAEGVDALPVVPAASPFTDAATAADFLAVATPSSAAANAADAAGGTAAGTGGAFTFASPTAAGRAAASRTCATPGAATATGPRPDPATLVADPGPIAEASIPRALQAIIATPGNTSCAECGDRDPKWASVNLGIVFCHRCSGVHRNLGVHVSQVRSLTLDSWRPAWARRLLAVGNTRAARYWEARLAGAGAKRPTPASSMGEVEAWCRAKYERRAFAAPGPAPHELLESGVTGGAAAIPGRSPAAGAAAAARPTAAGAAAGKVAAPRAVAGPSASDFSDAWGTIVAGAGATPAGSGVPGGASGEFDAWAAEAPPRSSNSNAAGGASGADAWGTPTAATGAAFDPFTTAAGLNAAQQLEALPLPGGGGGAGRPPASRAGRAPSEAGFGAAPVGAAAATPAARGALSQPSRGRTPVAAGSSRALNPEEDDLDDSSDEEGGSPSGSGAGVGQRRGGVGAGGGRGSSEDDDAAIDARIHALQQQHLASVVAEAAQAAAGASNRGSTPSRASTGPQQQVAAAMAPASSPQAQAGGSGDVDGWGGSYVSGLFGSPTGRHAPPSGRGRAPSGFETSAAGSSASGSGTGSGRGSSAAGAGGAAAAGDSGVDEWGLSPDFGVSPPAAAGNAATVAAAAFLSNSGPPSRISPIVAGRPGAAVPASSPVGRAMQQQQPQQQAQAVTVTQAWQREGSSGGEADLLQLDRGVSLSSPPLASYGGLAAAGPFSPAGSAGGGLAALTPSALSSPEAKAAALKRQLELMSQAGVGTGMGVGTGGCVGITSPHMTAAVAAGIGAPLSSPPAAAMATQRAMQALSPAQQRALLISTLGSGPGTGTGTGTSSGTGTGSGPAVGFLPLPFNAGASAMGVAGSQYAYGAGSASMVATAAPATQLPAAAAMAPSTRPAAASPGYARVPSFRTSGAGMAEAVTSSPKPPGTGAAVPSALAGSATAAAATPGKASATLLSRTPSGRGVAGGGAAGVAVSHVLSPALSSRGAVAAAGAANGRTGGSGAPSPAVSGAGRAPSAGGSGSGNAGEDEDDDDGEEWAWPADVAIRYEDLIIGRMIGRGGFSEVYRGMYRGTEVAVKKLLQKPGDAGAKAAEDFKAEVALMARLRHPNIVLLMGATSHPLCLITEYCSRGNLFDLLHNAALNLSWRLRLQLAVDAARGMNYLHTATPVIMHRDLKSLNILISSSWVAKISDFGLSRFKATTKSSLYTMQAGTFHWMAPEVIQGYRYTEKADVFSFGINLWELLTRQTPYAGTGLQPMQLAYAVLNNGLRPEVPASAPPEYAALMQACWSADPDARPPFSEIMVTLQRLLKREREREKAATAAGRAGGGASGGAAGGGGRAAGGGDGGGGDDDDEF